MLSRFEARSATVFVLLAHEQREELVERDFAVAALVKLLEKLLQVCVADVILESGLQWSDAVRDRRTQKSYVLKMAQLGCFLPYLFYKTLEVVERDVAGAVFVESSEELAKGSLTGKSKVHPINSKPET